VINQACTEVGGSPNKLQGLNREFHQPRSTFISLLSQQKQKVASRDKCDGGMLACTGLETLRAGLVETYVHTQVQDR
jgi:hypothetical protein